MGIKMKETAKLRELILDGADWLEIEAQLKVVEYYEKCYEETFWRLQMEDILDVLSNMLGLYDVELSEDELLFVRNSIRRLGVEMFDVIKNKFNINDWSEWVEESIRSIANEYPKYAEIDKFIAERQEY